MNRERDSKDDLRAMAMVHADEVYAEHAPLLRWLALKRFQIPEDDAEELVNDVFVSYFSNAVKVRVLRHYLVGAICNAARQYWRGRHEQNSIFSDATVSATVEEEVVELLNQKMLVATMLARVGSRCRDLLHRYYIEGETTKSIASRHETSTDYVLLLLHKCRKSAREIVRAIMQERE